MNNLRLFNSGEFGELGVLIVGGKEYFPATACAKLLGYAEPQKAIRMHCKGVSKLDTPTEGGNQMMNYIAEGDLYRLIVRSKLPAAERFERWVFDEVLPSIRKHGLYAVDELLNNPDMAIQAFTALKNEREKNKALQGQIEEQKPLVEFANHVSNTSDLIDMNRMAKLLNDEHIDIGRNRLFEWLRNKEILMKNNLPYQKYVNSGYFQVKESTKETAYGSKIFATTYVTGKGQIYITEMLRKELLKTA